MGRQWKRLTSGLNDGGRAAPGWPVRQLTGILPILREETAEATTGHVMACERTYGLMAVTDGGMESGALGGAAAQLVAGAVQGWFEEQAAVGPLLAMPLDDAAVQALSARVAGAARQMPPMASVALAAAVVEYAKADQGTVSYVWAGDARGYVLTPNGLIQATRDDLAGEPDAYEALQQRASLTNVVGARVPYRLHAMRAAVKLPCACLVATAGFYAHFKTPMHVEHCLLDTLRRASSLQDWEARLRAAASKIGPGDFSAVLMLLGFKSFGQLQESFAARHEAIVKAYIKPLQGGSNQETQARALWEKYSAEAGRTEALPTKRL